MKKFSLLTVSLSLALLGHAQVSTYVLEPPSLAGPVDFRLADMSWAAMPDMNDPANAANGMAVFVDDGSVGDPLGCNTLTNAAAVSGKIAVVYRGTCEFGVKAQNAQNAGAIGVVIINNAPGDPLVPGPGASGQSVSIPVVMISDVEGARLRSAIIAGTVRIRIGSLLGLFPNNLRVVRTGLEMPLASALPAPVAGGVSIPLGGFVYNYGASTEPSAVLRAVVTRDGVEVYNQSSTSGSIASGGNTFFSLPVFTLPNPAPSGYYEVRYTAIGTGTDGSPADNAAAFNFLSNEMFAYARLDTVSPHMPWNTGFYVPAGGPPNYMACSHFRNPNASRLKAEGLYISASQGTTDMDNVTLEGHLIQWNDIFSGTANATFNSLQTLDVVDYFYDPGEPSGQVVYIPFNRTFPLVDNQRYLFCVRVLAGVGLGHDLGQDYTRVVSTYDEVLFPNNYNNMWYTAGFGAQYPPSIGVKMTPMVDGINDMGGNLDVVPFPNPASAFIRVPLAGQTGAATLEVFDLSGAKVAERRVSVGNDNLLTVDVSGIADGAYMFHMSFEGGKQASFRVVVTK